MEYLIGLSASNLPPDFRTALGRQGGGGGGGGGDFAGIASYYSSCYSTFFRTALSSWEKAGGKQLRVASSTIS